MGDSEQQNNSLVEEEQERIQRVLQEGVEPPVPGSLVTAWILGIEYMTPDGKKYVARLRGPAVSRWLAEGILRECLAIEGDFRNRGQV